MVGGGGVGPRVRRLLHYILPRSTLTIVHRPRRGWWVVEVDAQYYTGMQQVGRLIRTVLQIGRRLDDAGNYIIRRRRATIAG
jgi:hypothetical protein